MVEQLTNCATLSALPPPPPGRCGWPWTEAHPALPASQPDGRAWPRVSIVTPSYNQGPFLEGTIRSVLLQGYPNLEYVIIDGGSHDESLEIIRKYSPWLAFWVSEPDGGQSAAIDRGFSHASGEVLGWLNSDDVYEPGALERVATHLSRMPGCGLVYGRGSYIDTNSRRTRGCDWIRAFDRQRFLTFNFILQPAAFWRHWLWEETGGLESGLHWAMDWDWFIRATARICPDYLPIELARFRLRPGIKTLSGGRRRAAEVAEVSRRHGGRHQPTYMMYRFQSLDGRSAADLGQDA
jgi:glycosyltransferase involved in cell wall biosynthesis